MADILFLALSVVFFAAMVGMTYAFEKLRTLREAGK